MAENKYAHLDKILAENEGWDGVSKASGFGSKDVLTPAQSRILASLIADGVVPASCATGSYIPEDVYAAIMGES